MKNRYATLTPAYNAHEYLKKILYKYFEGHKKGGRVLNHPFIEPNIQLDCKTASCYLTYLVTTA